MASFTIETNNIYTCASAENEQSAMVNLIEKIKEQIIQNKLGRFQVLDYSKVPPTPPVLRPTLNSKEIDAAINSIQPGELILGKSTLCSKVMIYMDENQIAWKVAVQNNNQIICVEPCGHKLIVPRENTNADTNKLEEQIDAIAGLPEHTEISWSGPNIFNKTNSHEYRMIIASVLEGIQSEPVIELDADSLDKIQILNQMSPWKILHIKSNFNNSHVFAVKNADGNIWIVVTDWAMKNVTCSFLKN